ncbi:MAG: hypothetical protein KF735_02900 [Chelatococcus sp.]|uniref:hypothetical protein n=1 Tax=Chelatococcus sp. TaxID=1953771 RepID=UPI0025B7F5AF|nr:hypothetical protein [Chelatococcus sp.]MBX3536563.1 hypothetical protein [Chelatococcus sp.]
MPPRVPAGGTPGHPAAIFGVEMAGGPAKNSTYKGPKLPAVATSAAISRSFIEVSER